MQFSRICIKFIYVDCCIRHRLHCVLSPSSQVWTPAHEACAIAVGLHQTEIPWRFHRIDIQLANWIIFNGLQRNCISSIFWRVFGPSQTMIAADLLALVHFTFSNMCVFFRFVFEKFCFYFDSILFHFNLFCLCLVTTILFNLLSSVVVSQLKWPSNWNKQ